MESDLEALRKQHLVETDWLADRLDDPAIRIVDMRGKVQIQTVGPGVETASYEGARDDYDEGHIPGAIYLDWTRDIVDLAESVKAQVAPPEKVASVFGGVGIGNETLVVAYDDHPAMQFASRLWWVAKYYGHDNVRLLNGGWAKWTAEGRPVSTDIPEYSPARFTPLVRRELRLTAEEVWATVCANAATIVDARDEGQFSGRIRRGPRGGHIPGALHLPREALFGPDGRFLEPQALHAAIDNAGIPDDRHVIAYCNGGVASTTVLFALSMLGRDRIANYDGSWNEWSGREDLPIEAWDEER